MWNPPGGAGKHLLHVASRAVGSSTLSGGPATSASAAAAASSSGGRPRASAGGRPLRATSPPSPSAAAAAAAAAVCWESCALCPIDGADEEVVAGGDEVVEGAPGAGEDDVDEYRLVFGYPPTGEEVRAAVSGIQQVFQNPFGVDTHELETQTALLSISGHSSSDNSSGLDDWIEPAAYVLNSTVLLTREHRNVLDAFRLLQRDPSVQEMVMALSSDKAVWDAVMNNEAVQEFRRYFHDGKSTEESLEGNSIGAAGVLKRILGNTRAKIVGFLEKITKLINILFHPGNEENADFNDAVRMSFMLSVFIFIVVAIARIK